MGKTFIPFTLSLQLIERTLLNRLFVTKLTFRLRFRQEKMVIHRYRLNLIRHKKDYSVLTFDRIRLKHIVGCDIIHITFTD